MAQPKASFWRRLLKRARKVFAAPVGRDTITQILRRAHSGAEIDEDRALAISAVFACVRLLSDAVSLVPWRLYEHRRDDGRNLLADDPLDRALHVQPNPEMPSMQWKGTMLSHALLWGNGYSEIEETRGQDGVNLWPLAPDRVTPTRDENGRLVYEVYQSAGNTVRLPPERVFHLRGLGFDGIVGYSVIRMARESLGLTLAAEKFGSSFFGGGARFGGMVKLEQATLDDKARGELGKLLDDHTKHGSTIILPQGVEWVQNTIPPDDAQFLETRKFQVVEIARWFGIPPHKLQSLDRSTYNNIEHQSIEFVQDAVLPWVVRMEQEADMKLLGKQKRRRQYTKMNLDALSRGDAVSRGQAHALARQWGWKSANDVRRDEDDNPIPDGGDEYLVQVNMIPERVLSKQADKPTPVIESDEGGNGDALTDTEGRRIAGRFREPLHE
jgi:HK97 family phage portal protein